MKKASVMAQDMESLNMAQRSSLFELGPKKAEHCGSSILSFAHEPEESEVHVGRKSRKIHYENTYQMEPAVKFQTHKVKEIIEQNLEKHLDGRSYEPIHCSSLTKQMSQEIKLQVKALGFKRYKLIAMVTIGEKQDQGVRIGSRCIWDADRDNYASGYYENSSLYAVGVVYAVYYE